MFTGHCMKIRHWYVNRKHGYLRENLNAVLRHTEKFQLHDWYLGFCCGLLGLTTGEDCPADRLAVVPQEGLCRFSADRIVQYNLLYCPLGQRPVTKMYIYSTCAIRIVKFGNLTFFEMLNMKFPKVIFIFREAMNNRNNSSIYEERTTTVHRKYCNKCEIQSL